MSHARIIDMEAAIRHGKDPMPWRVACFLADGAVTTMAGVRGGAKSWLAMATCAAVGRGDAVVGMQCTEGTALYIDAENGWRVMGRRFHVRVDHDAFIVANGMGLRLPKDDETVRALITETSATVCVLDSLRRLAPGAREDKSDDMAPIYSGLSGIAQQTGCGGALGPPSSVDQVRCAGHARFLRHRGPIGPVLRARASAQRPGGQDAQEVALYQEPPR